MKRPSNSDGDEASRFLHAAGELPASSPARRIGETVIPFPRSAAAALAAEGSEGAGVSSASASSTFIPLGVPARAVVMRIKQGRPRIRVERAAEGDFAARSDQSAAWEDEERR